MRNTYDLAFDGNGELFGAENSGERDDPEELNWLREGRNYGFPWRMGGNDNPLRNSPYDASADPLINPLYGGFQQGFFADDPTFPAPPFGMIFAEPVRNYGPDAAYFRDPADGHVRNAAAENGWISSFTAHRSPLGLVFDRDSILRGGFQGGAFVMSFMPGGDSTGYTPISPWGSPSVFVDPSEDLLHMELEYDAATDNYKVHTHRIAEGFYLPVDAELVGRAIYVLEHASQPKGVLWKVDFSALAATEEVVDLQPVVTVFPNPSSGIVHFDIRLSRTAELKLELVDVLGRVLVSENLGKQIAGNLMHTLDLSGIAPGIYFYRVKSKLGTTSGALEVK